MPKKSRFNLPPIKANESIGQRLARLRKERGITQVMLAKKIGIIQALVSAYELDKLRLNADMIIRFSKALGVNTDDILGLNGTTPKNGKPSLKIMRRLKRIESLSSAQQKVILQTLDTFLKGAEK